MTNTDNPAQELLASVQLERLREYMQRFACSSYCQHGECALVRNLLEQYPTPNKADAEALTEILQKVEAVKFGWRLHQGEYPRQEMLELVEAYEAATPLVKQIAGGG